jgi:hypothetical protein
MLELLVHPDKYSATPLLPHSGLSPSYTVTSQQGGKRWAPGEDRAQEDALCSEPPMPGLEQGLAHRCWLLWLPTGRGPWMDQGKLGEAARNRKPKAG